MIFLTEYTNRKGMVIRKKLEAKSTGSIRDYIRREGAKDITIIPEGKGYFCKKCKSLIRGYAEDEICDTCRNMPENDDPCIMPD